LNKLDTFINELIPDASDSRVERVKKAIKSVRKDDELKQIQADLNHQITTLSYGSSVVCMSRLAAHRCIGPVPTAPVQAIQNAPLRSTYGFPTTKVPKFIGRHTLLDHVAERLVASSTERAIVVLQGMGGQGKTQTALEVCSRDDIRQHFKPILWINASTEDSKGSIFERPQCKIDFVKERLEDHSRPSLIVFDNYDDLSVRRGDIKSYYPDDKRNSILITSRHEDSVNLGQGISVETMANDEAVSLLLHRSQLKESEELKVDAGDIVSHLGYLPLAIAQAGAYIHMKKIPFQEFINHYSQRKGAVLQQTPEIWEYGLSVFTTWEMSMENVSSDARFRNHVDGMLLFCAILHHDVINEEFLSHLLANVSNLPHWTEPFLTNHKWDSRKFQDTIANLGRLSLLQILKYKSGHYEFSLHPLVSDWLKLRIKPLQLCQSIENVMRIIALFIESNNGRRMTFEVRREVRTYVWSCLENLRDLENKLEPNQLQTDSILETKLTFAKFMYTDSQLSNGTRLLEEIFHFWQGKFGDIHPKTIAASKELAKGYTSLKRFKEAEKLIQIQLSVRAEALSDALADCYSAQGRHREAKDLYEELLRRLEKENGSHHYSTVRCMNSMANNYTLRAESQQETNDYSYAFSDDCSRAEKLWLAIVENTKTCPLDPSQEGYNEATVMTLAETYSSLGGLYHNRGLCDKDRGLSGAEHFANARETLCKALSTFEALYGPEHSRVLTVYHNIAVAMNQENDFEGSEIYYRRTLDGYEQFYGPEHEMTIKICHCYGHVLASQSKLLEGVALHTRSYMGLEDIYGPGDDSALSSFDCLIGLYKWMDNLLEVERLYKHALEKRTESLGRAHKITIDTAYDLACLYMGESRWADAEKYLQLTVDSYSENHPMDGPAWTDSNMLEAVNSLAVTEFYQGNFPPARILFERLLEWRVGMDGAGEHSASTLDVAMNLATLLEKMGEEAEVEAVHRRFDEGYHSVEKKAAEGEGVGEGERVETVEKGMADLAVTDE
jgi:tetratricopeptide (TPR) repeat protein